MLKPSEHFKKLLVGDDGASVVEYGVLIALVVAACIAIIIVLGGQIRSGFQSFSQLIESVGMTPPAAGS